MRRLSNNPEGTSFIFRISGSVIEDPRENPDDYEYTNYDQTDYDGDDKKSPTECPVDPYNDRCPERCNILTDEQPQPDDTSGVTDDAIHEKLPEPPHLARHGAIGENKATNVDHTREKMENSYDTKNEEEEEREEKHQRRPQQERQREIEDLQQRVDERRRDYDRQQMQRQQGGRHENQEEKMLQHSIQESDEKQMHHPKPITCAAAGEEACNANAGC
ncbi:hypothetical protein ANCDUO_03495, partial [Ancylostoma duodenale]